MAEQGCGVIIADENEQSRAEFKQCIQKTKYTVVAEVTNCDDLIAEYEKKRPELVVMCMALPGHKDKKGEGGQQGLARLMKLQPKPRAVISHTLDSQYLVVSALKLGAIASLRKPFKADKTIEALAKAEISKGGSAAVQRGGMRLRKSFMVWFKKASEGFFKFMREAIADDLSNTGMSIRTKEHLAEKTVLKLLIDLPGEKKMKLKLKGQVMRSKEIIGVGMHEIGIAFVGVPPDTQQKLQQFIVKTVTKTGS